MAAETEGDIVTQRDRKDKMKEFCIASTSFSGSEGGIVIVMSESPLNIPVQLQKYEVSLSKAVHCSEIHLCRRGFLPMGKSFRLQDRERAVDGSPAFYQLTRTVYLSFQENLSFA